MIIEPFSNAPILDDFVKKLIQMPPISDDSDAPGYSKII
jgi:hypothetical protein